MLFENVADGLIRDVVADVGPSSLDPIVSPRRILLGQSHDKLDNFLTDSRPADFLPLTAIVPLLGHQQAIPTQDRVGREQGANLFQPFATEDLALDRNSTPLVIAEQDTLLANFLFEHLVLGPQILDCLLLLTVDPGCQNQEQQLPRLENEAHD